MRLLLLFGIGLMFGFGGGFLAGGGLGTTGHGHDHAGHDHTGHDHEGLLEWDGPAPEIKLGLKPDIGNGLNLLIDVADFTFSPETVNLAPTPGTGHAHIYINGEKIARSYSAWFHLPLVLPGDIIRVTLNSDDHTPWGKNGTPIAAEITYR